MDCDHNRTIIHIDIDCFYAQVETIKNPELQNVPLGIQQKNIVVTCNYIARNYGIKKCMLISDAKKMCPNLVLVNGEDLHDYRQISYKVTNLLQTYTILVERLGLDENFIDVTELIKRNYQKTDIVGNVFNFTNSDNCVCGCVDRLTIATKLAQEIRNRIKDELNLTCCAGIGHNKLIAKVGCSLFKPNQQTVVFPSSALELLIGLKSLHKIPGLGRVTIQQLENLKIKTIEDLQNADINQLCLIFGNEKAKTIQNYSFGIDLSIVKPSGRPQTIGLEDSCKSITFNYEVREKIQQLLTRLKILVQEDGRIPKTLKLTVRKYDKNKNIHHRETRQCNIQWTNNDSKIMTTIMQLFNKIVNINKPYHITLLGLAFTKFHNNSQRTMVNYLEKNLEVQSLTSIENFAHNSMDYSPKSSINKLTDNSSTSSLSPIFDSLSTSSSPLTKKLKLDICPSPSKLNVEKLCLNESTVVCPPNLKQEIFEQLPPDIQKELWDDYNTTSESSCGRQMKKAKINTLYNYFIKN